MQSNLDNPGFNLLLTPAEAQADPSTWGENKPNRLRVWEEHRYAYDAWGNCIEKKSGLHRDILLGQQPTGLGVIRRRLNDLDD